MNFDIFYYHSYLLDFDHFKPPPVATDAMYQILIDPYFWVPFGTFTLYILHYFKNAVKKPELHCGNENFHKFLKENCPVVEEHYWPSVWCFNAHALTTLSIVFRDKVPKLQFDREYISTPDGGQISLDWYDPESSANVSTDLSRPISLILPGITGDSHSEYLRSLIPSAHQFGYRVVVLNYRGLGGNQLLTPRFYCAANYDDLETALDHIRVTNSGVHIIATGLSMGGAILSGYLTNKGDESRIDAACLVSACFDLGQGMKNLRIGLFNTVTDRLLAKYAKEVFLANKHVFAEEEIYNMEEIAKCKRLREFDEAVVHRMFGYESTLHYYEAATQAGKLNRIKVPTFCINAEDDMLAPRKHLPLDEIREKSSHVAMLVTARGGHIGFMEGFVPKAKPSFYLERVYHQYIEALAKLGENPRHVF